MGSTRHAVVLRLSVDLQARRSPRTKVSQGCATASRFGVGLTYFFTCRPQRPLAHREAGEHADERPALAREPRQTLAPDDIQPTEPSLSLVGLLSWQVLRLCSSSGWLQEPDDVGFCRSALAQGGCSSRYFCAGFLETAGHMSRGSSGWCNRRSVGSPIVRQCPATACCGPRAVRAPGGAPDLATGGGRSATLQTDC